MIKPYVRTVLEDHLTGNRQSGYIYSLLVVGGRSAPYIWDAISSPGRPRLKRLRNNELSSGVRMGINTVRLEIQQQLTT